jgi:hypothetical protein
MGGAGRWIDKNVLQNPFAGAVNPAALGYQAVKGNGLFKAPSFASDLITPPHPAPDLTDKAIQLARDRERRRQMGGGRTSTFLSGVLGDANAPSTFVKQLLGG